MQRKRNNFRENLSGDLLLEDVFPVVVGENAICILEKHYSTLSEYIRSKSIYWEDIRSIACDICKALIDCKNHGYYHLDVHPKNIYIDSNGRALLGDFGNAQHILIADVVFLNEMTPRHVHPEFYLMKNQGKCSINKQ